MEGTSCQIFPTDNAWHADISQLPVDARSSVWMKANPASTGNLWPDFGPAYGEQSIPYGIPITVVQAGSPRVPVTFEYASESDPGPYPLSSATGIEGGKESDGDRHAVVVDASTCRVYETFATYDTASGWKAASGAQWNLRSDALRPASWTSADAAGLSILAGLLRWKEVKAGAVHHAIRFTMDCTSSAYLWPARHQSGSGASTCPPFGARFRLKASFNISGYSAQAQVVLRAMKAYGLILGSNGPAWHFTGDADPGWPGTLEHELKSIPSSAFEAVNTSSLQISPNSGAAR